MVTDTKKIKVLLYGNLFRHYHSQILVKFLLDSKCHVSIVSPEFYITERLEQSFLIKKFLIIFYLIELFIKAAFADMIYLVPLNTTLIRSAIWAAKIFKKKLVVEMYISIYDTFVKDRKTIKDGSRKATALLEKDRLILTESDYIVYPAVHELNYWEKLIGIKTDQNKIFVSPICNVSNTVLKKNFIQDSVLRICWWGTFIPLHGLDKVLQAMKILKEQKVPFTCNLFGIDSPLFYIYAENIETNKLNQHVFLRKDLSFSNGSLPQYLVNNCDLALGIFGDTDKARNTVPNKLIEALSMGIPTLTMSSPALREFFNPETDFWTCEPSSEAIAKAIFTIASDVARPVQWEQTRQKVLNTFSVTQYQEVVSKVLERVANDLLEGKTSDVESGVFTRHQSVINQVKG